MTADPMRLLYIHGFNSSPESHKAQVLVQYCQRHLPRARVSVPRLSFDPAVAIEQLEAVVGQDAALPQLVIGSSLGGFYATWLAEKYRMKAVLVNPAVSPQRYLGQAFLGRHRNLYTGQEYEITEQHVRALAQLDCEVIQQPQNFLLLLQTGDEVLDYRLAVSKYAGCRQVVQSGGSHEFSGFTDRLPEVLAFAGLPVPA